MIRLTARKSPPAWPCRRCSSNPLNLKQGLNVGRNPSRLGQAQANGDAWALFKQNYTAETITSFVENYKLDGRVSVRNIESGKSASFPNVGTIGSEYHVPGTEIKGLVVEHNETIITLDPMLISHAFIANIDEAMNHYDVRSEYTRQQGAELALKRMQNELRCAILAARTTEGKVEGQPGGAIIKAATMASDPTVLADAFRNARMLFDEKLLPDNPQEFTGALAPAQWYLLTENKDLIDRDINAESNGSYGQAIISSVARIPLVKINAMPRVDESALASIPAKYRGNFADTVGVIFHRSAVGTLKLLDLSLEDVYQGEKQGTLMLAKYALGHGILAPRGAIELSKARKQYRAVGQIPRRFNLSIYGDIHMGVPVLPRIHEPRTHSDHGTRSRQCAARCYRRSADQRPRSARQPVRLAGARHPPRGEPRGPNRWLVVQHQRVVHLHAQRGRQGAAAAVDPQARPRTRKRAAGDPRHAPHQPAHPRRHVLVGPTADFVTWFLAYEELPESARRYIAVRAARLFQTSVLGSDQLYVFTEKHEEEAYLIFAQEHADFTYARGHNFLSGSTDVSDIWDR